MYMSVGIQALHEVSTKCGCQDQALEFLHFFLSGYFYEDSCSVDVTPHRSICYSRGSEFCLKIVRCLISSLPHACAYHPCQEFKEEVKYRYFVYFCLFSLQILSPSEMGIFEGKSQ